MQKRYNVYVVDAAVADRIGELVAIVAELDSQIYVVPQRDPEPAIAPTDTPLPEMPQGDDAVSAELSDWWGIF